MKRTWLVFDIGTSSAKAALTRGGEILRSATSGYDTRREAGGIVEQRAEDWWAAVVECCRELAIDEDLAGVALTGQMQDLVLLDENRQPVRPVILYSDLRAHEQMAEIHRLVDAEELARVAGAWQSAGSLLAKLRWLRQNEARTLERARHLLLGGADYIAARMTGGVASDSTTAATTGLWQLRAGELLSLDLLARMELAWARPLLPRVGPGGARVGHVSGEAAAELGISADIPVHLGPGDAGSATIGAGCGEPGPAYAYIGSSGWVGFSAREIGDAAAGVMTLSHPKRGHFIQVAPMMTGAGNLEWLRALFASESHDQIIAAAVASPPDELIFLPYLQGERAPFDDPFARGAFIGIDGETGKAALSRAVLEGMVFAYRHTLSALMPQPPEHLTLIGGGARSDSLNQLFADIIGLPVHLPPDAGNAGLHGAVRAAEVGLGASDSYAIAPSPRTRMLEPLPEHSGRYGRKFERFLAAYQALKPIFRDAAPQADASAQP